MRGMVATNANYLSIRKVHRGKCRARCREVPVTKSPSTHPCSGLKLGPAIFKGNNRRVGRFNPLPKSCHGSNHSTSKTGFPAQEGSACLNKSQTPSGYRNKGTFFYSCFLFLKANPSKQRKQRHHWRSAGQRSTLRVNLLGRSGKKRGRSGCCLTRLSFLFMKLGPLKCIFIEGIYLVKAQTETIIEIGRIPVF